MKTKHTPGPWETGDQNRSIFQANNGPLIALVQGRAESNAALIAAAPELLEALERTLPWLAKALAEDIQHGTAMPRDLEMALDQANAAIAKAKGA